MPQRAASILRVSTKKQLNEGDGIENQRRGNAEHIRRKGYILVKEFVIAESADGPERDDFEAAVQEIISRRREIDVVVFWKVDRISRGGVLPYYTLKGVLAKHGVRVEFATEQIDGSATGELMETLLAGMARFENRLRVERTIGVEKILTREGYWCRAAPTGFRNGRSEGKPVLLPSEEPGQWGLLRHGLRKQMEGAYTLAEVADEMRREGLRTPKGGLVCKQTWLNICRSPVYGGMLRGKWTGGEFVRAKFDGPLSPQEWQELQQVLDGKRRTAASAPRQRLHPAFPLRRFLLCPGCGRPARGYSTKGRSGAAFAYYDCQRPACRFRVQAGEAHEAFVGLLRRVKPEEGLLGLFRDVVLDAWASKQQEMEAGMQAGRAARAGLEEEKGRLVALMKRSADNPALLAELEKDFGRVEGKLSLAKIVDRDAAHESADKEEVVDACIEGLKRADELWGKWPVEGRSKLQRLVFPGGINYGDLAGNRTPQLSLLYGAFSVSLAPQSRMAPPAWRVTNQVIDEMIAWFNLVRGLPVTE